jgi:integrase/recombinase XerD
MATIKAVLRKNGAETTLGYPIAIRFTQNRKSKYHYINHYSKEKAWDPVLGKVKSTHPLHLSLNVLIANKKLEIEKHLLELENKNKSFSLEQLKQKVIGGQSPVSFFQYADKYVDSIFSRGKINVAKSERSRINKFKEFLKGRSVEFFEVDVAMLKNLKIHLLSNENSEKTVNNYFITIRTIFNKAIAEGLIGREYYPFGGRDKIQLKSIDGKKIGLESDELDLIRKVKLTEDSPNWHTRNVFLLSFNFAGIRISDLLILRWSDIQNNRLQYTMGKNHANVSIPLSAEAKEIIACYRDDRKSIDDFVLPYLKHANLDDPEDVQRKINAAISNLNKRLKKIATQAKVYKNISNHISRHTFGNIAGDKIPISVLQKLYRHKSLNTTAVYQGNFIHKDTDEALLKVVDSM